MENILQRTKLPVLVALVLFLAHSVGLGQLPQAIQSRMLDRLPQVDALKQQRRAGENNVGLLQPLKPLDAEQQAVVKDENQDRKKVYQALAARTGAAPGQIAVARARQIARRSAPGVMIQNQRGEWVEKGEVSRPD